ncbi:hypothetical protein [Chryseobacterium populi]|uniref:PrcB C-terminal domain-containing protein n=1 Tax=Chryseobacterium populi TaxID=1144316 RepID=J3CM73_9FLAO|nr:hypothetical protein [Chryseobacterium populi]EJL74331.1 hypothetical protein PMI13_01069 [Chryseobacterium populi]
MNKLFVLLFAIIMSCTSTPSQSSRNAGSSGDILASEPQGGTETAGFTIIKDEAELQKIIKGNSGLIDLGKDTPPVNYPPFPENKKVILYNLGTFRSGNHAITQIKSLSVKDNVLYVEVPLKESGGMEIQVISQPWLIFTAPSDYQFNSVELKYSK